MDAAQVSFTSQSHFAIRLPRVVEIKYSLGAGASHYSDWGILATKGDNMVHDG